MIRLTIVVWDDGYGIAQLQAQSPSVNFIEADNLSLETCTVSYDFCGSVAVNLIY